MGNLGLKVIWEMLVRIFGLLIWGNRIGRGICRDVCPSSAFHMRSWSTFSVIELLLVAGNLQIFFLRQ